MTDIGVALYVLFNFSPSKKYLLNHLDPKFIERMIGNPMVKALKTMVGGTIGVMAGKIAEKIVSEEQHIRRVDRQSEILREMTANNPKFPQTAEGKACIATHTKLLQQPPATTLLDSITTKVDSGIKYTSVTETIKSIFGKK